MKTNTSFTIISVILSALISYGFYTYAFEESRILMTIGSFITMIVPLIFMLSIQFELPRTTLNIRAVSSVFLIFFIILNFLGVIVNLSMPLYIISSGILLCIFLILLTSINRARQ
jgi:hypothetical protein